MNDIYSHEQPALFEILVPCQWNDGKPIRTRHHREWDKRVRAISDGMTILKPGKGQWVHNDELYEDRIIPVRIFCTHAQITAISQITIEHYEQLAVMYYQLSDWCLITSATPEQEAKFLHKRNNLPKEVSNAYSP